MRKPYFISATKLGVEFDANPSTNEQVMISECSRQSNGNTENTATKIVQNTKMSEEGPAKTSYGYTEKLATVPSTNISVCTTIPDDGPSKKKPIQTEIRRKDLKVYVRQN